MVKVRKVALSALIAGAAGYVAGILTAPKSGKETRKDIKNAASQAKAEAEKNLKKLHSELTDLIKQAKQKTQTVTTKAQKELGTMITKAQGAKDQARDLLTNLHEGYVDDKDLKRAIKDASSAVDHLKSYLGRHGKKSKQ